MDGAWVCMSEMKPLKALVPTECMRVEPNVCLKMWVFLSTLLLCHISPLLIDFSYFSSDCNNISPVFPTNELSTVETRQRQFHWFYPCWFGRGGAASKGDNKLVIEQYSRGFLVGGGSVKPRYGLFSESNLRLYFCLPPRTRSRRTPRLETTRRTWDEKSVFFSDKI